MPTVSLRRCFHAHNFAGFAFGGDLERTAANFAIGCEPLAGQARVNHHFAVLAAVRTLDVCEFFHAAIYPPPAKVQIDCGKISRFISIA